MSAYDPQRTLSGLVCCNAQAPPPALSCYPQPGVLAVANGRPFKRLNGAERWRDDCTSTSRQFSVHTFAHRRRNHCDPSWSVAFGGNASFAHSALAEIGVSPSPMASYLIIYLELIGGAGVVFGLFTRVFAVALAVAAVFWANPSGLHGEFEPWEFPLVLALVLFLIASVGSGPWSLDRLLWKR